LFGEQRGSSTSSLEMSNTPLEMIKAGLRALVRSQVALSGAFDGLLPKKFVLDGYLDFQGGFAPRFLAPGMLIYDVGGGKNPFINPQRKRELGLRVIGLDIDPLELAAAPQGSYDVTICEDIARYRGVGDGDVVVCAALLEHVRDTEAALAALHSILKPGGIALLFVPSRHAVYARLNLLIPHKLKQKILYAVFPETWRCQGFRAYYNRCTPYDLGVIARTLGFQAVDFKPYFFSSYFSFFFPFYALWRIWMLIFYCFSRDQAAETFSIALKKT